MYIAMCITMYIAMYISMYIVVPTQNWISRITDERNYS